MPKIERENCLVTFDNKKKKKLEKLKIKKLSLIEIAQNA